MNTNKIIFFDAETSSVNPHRTQILSLGAVMIDPRTLKFDKNDIFYSLFKPEFDLEKANSLGLDGVEDGALKVNKLTREELAEAPITSVVFEKFTAFVNRYKSSTSPWGRAIPAGFNITNFDNIIINRLCSKAPYDFGPKDKNNQPTLFHPRDIFDLQKLLGMVTENFPNISSQSMDSYREFFAFPKTAHSHHALYDVLEGAALLCKFLGHFRKVYSEAKLRGTMSDFKIEEYLD